MVRFVLSLSRARKRSILFALDVAAIPLAWIMSFILQYGLPRGLDLAFETVAPVPLLALVAGGVSLMLGLPSVRLKDFDIEALLRVALLALIVAVASAALNALGRIDLRAGFHVVLGMVYFAVAAGGRVMLLKALLAVYRQSEAITRVAIYGAGRTGMALAKALRNRSDVVPVAFLDDNATLRDVVVAGLPVYSGVQIGRLMAKHRVDRVIMAMPSLSVQKQTFLSRRLEALGLDVQTLPAFAQLIGDRDLLQKLSPARPGALLSRDQMRHDPDALQNGYHEANVLISGAGGSIGIELCRQVVALRPRRLVLLELSELALYNAEMEIRLLAADCGCEIVGVLGSAADGPLVERVLRSNEIGIVLHAAAYKHVPIVEDNMRAGVLNNTFGTAILAQKARDLGVGRFVLVSTDKAVRPANVMGATKRLAEMVIQDLATRSERTIFSIVRFGNVLGSSGSVIPLFQDQIARGGPVTLTDEDVTRYFMTIQEAAGLVLLAGVLAEGGEVFVLDMGQPIRIADLARQLIVGSGHTVRDAENPDGDIEIVVTGLRPGEKLHEELMVTKGAQLTAHPKIVRLNEEHPSQLETAAALRDLRQAADRDDPSLLRATLERWVPTLAPAAPVPVVQGKPPAG